MCEKINPEVMNARNSRTFDFSLVSNPSCSCDYEDAENIILARSQNVLGRYRIVSVAFFPGGRGDANLSWRAEKN